jgi:hypothetical protein
MKLLIDIVFVWMIVSVTSVWVFLLAKQRYKRRYAARFPH